MNQINESTSPVSFAGVACTSHHLQEFDGSQCAISVPIKSIERITLRHGFQAPHPIALGIMGLGLTALGFLGLAQLICGFSAQESAARHIVMMIPTGIFGLWVLRAALRRGMFLDLELHDGRKRLAFHGRLEQGALDEFVSAIEARTGLSIARDL